MKKIIITLLLALVVFGCVTACSNAEISGELPEYQYYYDREFVGEWDGDMMIDGVLSEERWQNKRFVEFSSYGMTARFTATFTEKGVYIAAVAEDTDITYYGRFDMHNNSCFCIYLAKYDTTKYSSNNALRLEVDPYDMRSYNQNQFYGAAKVIGEPNSKNTVSLTAELFVEWKSLGYTAEEIERDGIPPEIKINPTYHFVNRRNDGSMIRGTVKATNCEPTWMTSYIHFDENGYVNYDRYDAVLGDGALGMNKSDGWDLSKLEQGEVTSNRGVRQTLFFKDIYSENFVAETTLYPNYSISDSNPQTGLCVLSDRVAYRAMLIHFNSLKNNNTATLRLLTGYPDDGWHESATGFRRVYTAGELLDGLQIKVVKNGNLLLYFVENEFAYSERVSYLEGKCSPALYSLGSSTTYTNFSAKAMTEQETLEYLENECGVFVVDQAGTIIGGKVIPSTDAVVKGGSITLTIVPDPGFALSSFKNYDADLYEQVKAGINGNEFVLENIQDGVNISATFKRITKANETVKITGRVVSSLSTAQREYTVASAKILIRDKYNPLVNYTYETSTIGAYTVSFMPKAGTYNIDGKDIVISGVYEMVVSSDGYRDHIQEIIINDQTSATINNDITLYARNIGGPAFSSEFDFVSTVSGWDLSDEINGNATAKNASNQVVWFTSTNGRRSIIEFDAENACLPGLEEAPGVGIVIGNKNTKLMALLFNGNIRINPELNWNNGVEYSNDSTYNMSKIGEKVRVRFVHDGETLAIFVHDYDKHASGHYDLVFEKKFPELNALSAYGLVITQTKQCEVRFTNASVRSSESDPSVVSEIRSLLYGKVTVSGNDASKSTITVTGTDSAGFVKKGEIVSIKVETTATVQLNIGGKKYIVNSSKTINAKIDGDTVISVTYPQNLYEVSGNILGIEGFAFDLKNTVVSAVNGDNEFVFDGVVSPGGVYSIYLPNGTYDLVFRHEYYLDKVVSDAVVVNGASATAQNAQFTSLMPLSSVMVAGTNVNGSTNSWTINSDGSVTSVTAKKAVGESKFFNVGVKEYAIETTFKKLDTSGAETHPMVGLAVQNKEGYALLVQDNASFSKLALYIVTTTGEYKAHNVGSCNYKDGKITLKMVNDDGVLYIFVNGVLFKTINDDGKIFTQGFLKSFVTVGVRSVGHITTFYDTKVAVSPQGVLNARSYAVTAKATTGGTLTAESNGAPVEFGYIPAGKTVKIIATADSGKTLGSITVNGKEVVPTRTATGGYFEITPTEDIEIDAFFFEGTASVSGTVSTPHAGAGDVTDTVISVKVGQKTAYFYGAVSANGSYSITAPSDATSIIFDCEGFMLETVDYDGQSTVNVVYDKIAPKKTVKIDAYDYNGTAITHEWAKTEDSVTSTDLGREVRYFGQMATKFEFEVTIDEYDSTKKPFAGIVIKALEREFAFMMYRENNGSERIGFLLTNIADWSNCKWVVGVATNDASQCTIKAVCDGQKLEIFFNGTKVISSDGATTNAPVINANYTDNLYSLRGIVNKECAIGLITTGAYTTFSNIALTIND